MDTRHLIDAIMRQTTVLIAQLSTAAGLRSPLAHLADDIFVSLAREIEQQGVGKKVAADMFGLALRSYQRRVQRLEESESVRERTLWEAVLQFVSDDGPVKRDRVLERFRHDEERSVSAVLNDLVRSGLLYSAGSGAATLYSRTSEADRLQLADAESAETVATLVWGAAFRNPGSRRADMARLAHVDAASAEAAVDALLQDGRLSAGEDGKLIAAPFVIPLGAASGWEAAVFDHFQAMATAIGNKLRLRTEGDPMDALVGGSTLHFGIYPGHPHEQEVLATLRRVRDELNRLSDKVTRFNTERPIDDEAATRVTFYYGQQVQRPDGARAPRQMLDGNTPLDPGETA